MNVQDVIDDILRAEGNEYTNDPADSGGPTKYGITLETLQDSRSVECTADDVRRLSEDEARRIYLTRYYAGPRLDLLAEHSELVAAEVMDTGVNTGMRRAVRLLQRALNALNDGGQQYDDVKEDGRVGPATAGALADYLEHRGAEGEKALFVLLNCLQGAYYVDLVERRRKDERFMYGWLRHRIANQVLA